MPYFYQSLHQTTTQTRPNHDSLLVTAIKRMNFSTPALSPCMMLCGGLQCILGLGANWLHECFPQPPPLNNCTALGNCTELNCNEQWVTLAINNITLIFKCHTHQTFLQCVLLYTVNSVFPSSSATGLTHWARSLHGGQNYCKFYQHEVFIHCILAKDLDVILVKYTDEAHFWSFWNKIGVNFFLIAPYSGANKTLSVKSPKSEIQNQLRETARSHQYPFIRLFFLHPIIQDFFFTGFLFKRGELLC